MIRYLSCVHDHAEENLTEQEMKLLKTGKGVIVTENNTTRFEEVNLKEQPKRNGLLLAPKSYVWGKGVE